MLEIQKQKEEAERQVQSSKPQTVFPFSQKSRSLLEETAAMLEIQRQRDEVERQVRASQTSPSAPAVPKNPPTQTTPSNIKTSAYGTGTPYRGVTVYYADPFRGKAEGWFHQYPRAPWRLPGGYLEQSSSVPPKRLLTPEARLRQQQERAYKERWTRNPFKDIPIDTLRNFHAHERELNKVDIQPGSWYTPVEGAEQRKRKAINEENWYQTFGYNTSGLLNTFKTLWNNPEFNYLIDANNIEGAAYEVIDAQQALNAAARQAAQGTIDPRAYRRIQGRYYSAKRNFLSRLTRVQNELNEMGRYGLKEPTFDNYLTYKAIKAYENFLTVRAHMPQNVQPALDDARAWIRVYLKRELLDPTRHGSVNIHDVDRALLYAERGLYNYLARYQANHGIPFHKAFVARERPMRGYVSRDEILREKAELTAQSMMPNLGYDIELTPEELRMMLQGQ